MARELFMLDHPWFKGIVEHRWSSEQIVLGEIQHYLRVRTNPIFFGYIVTNVASERNYALMNIVMENFMEELGGRGRTSTSCCKCSTKRASRVKRLTRPIPRRAPS